MTKEVLILIATARGKSLVGPPRNNGGAASLRHHLLGEQCWQDGVHLLSEMKSTHTERAAGTMQTASQTSWHT
jgi:hypothetical protein